MAADWACASCTLLNSRETSARDACGAAAGAQQEDHSEHGYTAEMDEDENEEDRRRDGRYRVRRVGKRVEGGTQAERNSRCSWALALGLRPVEVCAIDTLCVWKYLSASASSIGRSVTKSAELAKMCRGR